MIGIDIIRKKRNTSGTSGGSVGSGISTPSGGDVLNAVHADDADHANRADEAVHASSAKELDGTSSVWNTIRTWISGATDGLKDIFLRKDQDDETAHKLTMGEAAVKGDITIGANGSYYIGKDGVAKLAGVVAEFLKSSDFRPGTAMGFDGTGYGITKGTDGKYTLEIDNLIARMKMIIAELEVHEMSFIGGTVVMCSCGNRVDVVQALDAGGSVIASADGTKPTLTIPSGKTAERFRCYFLASDGDRQIKNEWSVGQLARAKTNNIAAPGNYKDYQNRDYWRLVVGVSDEPVTIEGKDYHYIDLSNSTSKDIALTDAAGTTRHVTLGGVSETLNSLVFAGDNIIGLGHCWDSARQNAAVLSVVALGWTLYKGIDHYDLPSENIVNKFGIDETIVTTDNFILRPYAAPSETQTVTVMRGVYDDSKSYGHNDLVTYNGQVWICTAAVGKTVTGATPSLTGDGANYWTVYAVKGADGKDGKSARRTAVVNLTSDRGTVFNGRYNNVLLRCSVEIDGKSMGGRIPRDNFSWTRDGHEILSSIGYRYRLASSSDALDLWECSVKIPKRLLEPVELTALRADGNSLIFHASEDISRMTLYPCWKRNYKLYRFGINRNAWGFHDMVHDEERHYPTPLPFTSLGDNNYSVDMSQLLSFVESHNIVLHKTAKVTTKKTALKHGKHTYWLKQGADGKYHAWGRYGVWLADGSNYTPVSTVAKCKIYVETDSDTSTTGTASLSV